MKRRDFLKLGGASSLYLAGQSFLPSPLWAQNRRPPNIIFIMADDLGAEGISCYGSKSFSTPAIDALASKGLKFNNAFATPLCSPSRAEVMSGLYPHQTGWDNNISKRPMEEQHLRLERSFAHTLKEQDYATAVIGKWQLAHLPHHPSHPVDLGFDESCLWAWKINSHKTTRYWNPYLFVNQELQVGGPENYGPDLCCQFGLDFITHQSRQNKPFFLYYPMILPHSEYFPTPHSEDLKKEMELARQIYRSGGSLKKRRLAGAQAFFPAMVAYMDTLVGKIVDHVERLGIAEDTLIIFTTDNGTANEVTSLFYEQEIPGGKYTLRERGIRVPFISYWKGQTPVNQTTEELLDFTDLHPTFAAMAGFSVTGLPGRSALPVICGQSSTDSRDHVLCEFQGRRLIRNHEFMLVNNQRFFDLRDNRYQEVNIYGHESCEQLRNRKKLQQVLDTLPDWPVSHV